VRPDLPVVDCPDVPFLTIDPLGSTDLEQAMALTRDGEGYSVLYAIANVAAFVAPGGAIDREAHRRGETLLIPRRALAAAPTRAVRGRSQRPAEPDPASGARVMRSGQVGPVCPGRP